MRNISTYRKSAGVARDRSRRLEYTNSWEVGPNPGWRPSHPAEESVASGEICMRERARDTTGKVLPRKEHTARRRGPDEGFVQMSRRRKKGKQKEGVVVVFRGDA